MHPQLYSTMRAKCRLSSCYPLDDFARRIWQLCFAGIIVRPLSAPRRNLAPQPG
jgi:hypothetical protein